MRHASTRQLAHSGKTSRSTKRANSAVLVEVVLSFVLVLGSVVLVLRCLFVAVLRFCVRFRTDECVDFVRMAMSFLSHGKGPWGLETSE